MPHIKKTKLFLIITKGNFGGAQRYVYDLAVNLSKTQYEITVILGTSGILETKLNNTGIRTLQINSLKRNINPLSDLASFFSLIKLFHQEKPDIIHLNSSKVGGIGSLAGRITGIPKIIFTGHGWAFNEKRNSLTKALILFSHWLTIILSHQVIAVSKKTKINIYHLPLVRKKITVVYNGINNFFLLDKKEGQEKLISMIPSYDLTSVKKIWLGSIAELHQNKGLDIALDALSTLIKTHPQLIYLIIGEGEERIKLAKLIKKLNLTNNVFLIGFIPEARQYLSAFDIFLLPSRTEALPYAILEAGLANLPVIASQVGGVSEIIENGQNGQLVPKENSTEITKAIKLIIASQKRQQRLGDNLKQSVKKKFSLTKMIKETEKVYKK